MSAAPRDEPTVERQAWRGGILHRRTALLLVLIVLLVIGTFGLSNRPIEGAAPSSWRPAPGSGCFVCTDRAAQW